MRWGKLAASGLIVIVTTAAYLPGILLSLAVPGFWEDAQNRAFLAMGGIAAAVLLAIAQEVRTLRAGANNRECNQREVEWRLTTFCTKILSPQAKARACLYVRSRVLGISIPRYVPYANAELKHPSAPYWVFQGLVGSTVKNMLQKKEVFTIFDPQHNHPNQIYDELKLRRLDQTLFMSDVRSGVGYALIKGNRIVAVLEITSPEAMVVSELGTPGYLDKLEENARLILAILDQRR